MSAINDLLVTVESLRAPDTGCPWDIEQTHQSIADCLVDECCELLQTIDRKDMYHMEEELGDVLLQVVMHAQMAKESGHFDFESICLEVNSKLIRRHPHVFGHTNLGGAEAALNQWDAIKASEIKRGPKQKGLFKDLPYQLPALLSARDVYKQIRKLKLTASKIIDEEAIEAKANALDHTGSTVGKELFEIAAACRIKGLDPEALLRRYTQSVVDYLEQ